MCNTRADHLVHLARQGADVEHELRKAVRELPEGMGLKRVREELEERGDEGALRFLERVLEDAGEWSDDPGTERRAGEADRVPGKNPLEAAPALLVQRLRGNVSRYE